MAGPDAGWYEHPTSGLVQWWTGDAWTADVLDGPTEAAAPAPSGQRLKPATPSPTSSAATRSPSKAKNSGWGTAILTLVVLGIMGWACSTNSSSPSTSSFDDSLASTGATVAYCWSGSASSVDITPSTSGGDTRQQSGKANNQCLSQGHFAEGAFAYISVQNGTEYGGVTCSIKLDGRVVKKVSSDGAYVIATCSGRI